MNAIVFGVLFVLAGVMQLLASGSQANHAENIFQQLYSGNSSLIGVTLICTGALMMCLGGIQMSLRAILKEGRRQNGKP